MNKSLERAKEIINHHLKNISSLNNSIFISVILVGSLSDNSYTGNAGSDIDLIHVLSDNAPSNSRDIVFKTITKTEQETNNDIPISRCIYRYSDLFIPYSTDFDLNLENKDLMELPIEIMRIKDSGITIFGENIIEKIDNPTREDIILFKNISGKWNELLKEEKPDWYVQYLKTCENPTIRIIVQTVIIRAMLDFFFETGMSCSSKLKIADNMYKEVTDYRFQRLLDLCVKWRYLPTDITQDEEEYMRKAFREWNDYREGKGIDYVPLMSNTK
ncbi:hypothetical protein [Proteiniborus sp. MB09-C3]|uniref:hypothetical protein n=1 Tax=Proteiniborus sp. MB09-C3 TaxID=3050072 RepID=UPI0025523734|nr:hypothetical protein [Proteiniborus sp. MB09-C3]WIV11540.1 hypothetical protein QO263_15775 [Proteiniborus sp. MB09-C3]